MLVREPLLAASQRALAAFVELAAKTNADDPQSYRSDDGEGCLAAVHHSALEEAAALKRAVDEAAAVQAPERSLAQPPEEDGCRLEALQAQPAADPVHLAELRRLRKQSLAARPGGGPRATPELGETQEAVVPRLDTAQGLKQRLEDLIGDYWDLAQAEAREGRDHDTRNGDAQRTWQEISQALGKLAAMAQLHAEVAEAAPGSAAPFADKAVVDKSVQQRAQDAARPDEGTAPAHLSVTTLVPLVSDLVLLVTRMAHRLRAASEGKGFAEGHRAIADTAEDFLVRKGLLSKPLRSEPRD